MLYESHNIVARKQAYCYGYFRAKKLWSFIKMTIIHWRRRRDLNPRAGFPTYTLSRGASSANLSTSPCTYKACQMLRITIFWRREWDSNPRTLARHRFSRPALSTAQTSLHNRRIILYTIFVILSTLFLIFTKKLFRKLFRS